MNHSDIESNGLHYSVGVMNQQTLFGTTAGSSERDWSQMVFPLKTSRLNGAMTELLTRFLGSGGVARAGPEGSRCFNTLHSPGPVVVFRLVCLYCWRFSN